MAPDPVHWSHHLFSTVFLLGDLTIRVGLSVRVIMRRRPYPITLAWLVVILLLPFAGSFIYLLLGENRLSDKRTARIMNSIAHYQHWLQTLRGRPPVQWRHLNPECGPLQQQAEALAGIPALAGNALELIDRPEDIIRAIIDDIDQARSTCHLQFYIWEPGGMVDEVMAGLRPAAGRLLLLVEVLLQVLLGDLPVRPLDAPHALGHPDVRDLRRSMDVSQNHA